MHVVRLVLRGVGAAAGSQPRFRYTLVVGGARPSAATPMDQEALDAGIRARLSEGESARDIATELAAQTGRPRREVYTRVVAILGEGRP